MAAILAKLLGAAGGAVAGPIGWFLNLVLGFVWDKISAIIHAAWVNHLANLAKKEQADKDKQQLEQAKTPEEKKNAATAINRDTFGSS